MSKSWEEFEIRAAEAAAARTDEWGFSQQWDTPVRCVFLGPATAAGDAGAAGGSGGDAAAAPRAAGAAGGSSADAERTPIGHQQKVRFRWTIAAPDVPPGVARDADVTAQANRVFMGDRGIPVPAAWSSALKFGAQVRRAQARAREECPDHVCTIHGLYRGPSPPVAAEPAAGGPQDPRPGSKWVVQEPDGARADVWVAAHHTGREWWCVKAPGLSPVTHMTLPGRICLLRASRDEL